MQTLQKTEMGSVEVGSVKHRRADGAAEIYCGRGRAPSGMADAGLGNPFVVGATYAQGEAAAAYLPHLRALCRRDSPERRTIARLAARVRAGERLRLMCWCKQPGRDVPCHADHIRAAVLGYARTLEGYKC